MTSSRNPMLTPAETRRGLLGALEAALLMPGLSRHFGTSRDEALRSFFVPAFLFPLTLLAIHLPTHSPLAAEGLNALTFFFASRVALTWALIFGSVFWLAKRTARNEYFCQFVIAMNWLSVPSLLAFAPAVLLLESGSWSWAALYPFMLAVTVYTYIFSAYAAAKVLRLPWQMGGFFAMIAFCANNGADNVLQAIIQSL